MMTFLTATNFLGYAYISASLLYDIITYYSLASIPISAEGSSVIKVEILVILHRMDFANKV